MSQAQTVRFPILTPEEMSPRQKEVAAAIAGGPRGGIRGPFLALIHNAELANRIQQLGEHLRYGNSLSLAQIELIVLTVARHWNCQYEWFAHERIARTTTDLADGIIKALALGQTPANMTAEETTLHLLAKQSLANGEPSDAVYEQAAKFFGRAGVLDALALTGYYSMMAMILNSSRIPLPEGTPIPLQPLKK
ncbi:MAG: carboxymuconolactone decarboxylase family protein [Alcaligenaceae bacterium]